MNFELSDEQRAFQETARAFAREDWLRDAPHWDERREFPVCGFSQPDGPVRDEMVELAREPCRSRPSARPVDRQGT